MTQMRLLEDFLPHVLPYAPSAPEPTVFKQLRDVCRDFCEATKAWRETDSFTVAAPDYEGLTTIGDAAIVSIEDCRLDGAPLTPKTVAELDAIRSGWIFDTEAATARFVTQIQPDTLTIYPRQSGKLELRLVLQPSLEALAVPDWLIGRYGSQLGKGAAARLLLLPQTEFYNAALAAPLLSEFDAWRNSLSIKLRKGQQGGRNPHQGSTFLMTASTYSANAYLNAFLRGVAPARPTDVFVSLHKGDPGATGTAECVVATWPAYKRTSALGGGIIADAFTAAANKLSRNTREIKFPAYDGTGTEVITHYALWDAMTAGNCLFTGKLVKDPDDVLSEAAPKTLGPTDELVVYPGQLGVSIR